MAKNADDFENLAQLCAVGYTIRESCEQLGLAENTAYRITAKADWKARVSAIRTEKMEGISGSTLRAAHGALMQLEALGSTAEKDADKIAACKAILQMLIPLAENTELRRRIEELERRAAEQDTETGVNAT